MKASAQDSFSKGGIGCSVTLFFEKSPHFDTAVDVTYQAGELFQRRNRVQRHAAHAAKAINHRPTTADVQLTFSLFGCTIVFGKIKGDGTIGYFVCAKGSGDHRGVRQGVRTDRAQAQGAAGRRRDHRRTRGGSQRARHRQAQPVFGHLRRTGRGAADVLGRTRHQPQTAPAHGRQGAADRLRRRAGSADRRHAAVYGLLRLFGDRHTAVFHGSVYRRDHDRHQRVDHR